MKTIRVAAAVIREGDKIFATAKGYGEFKGQWEFPGGKIEAGETSQQALQREVREELDIDICVEELIDTIEYDYPTFHLSMDCFWASIIHGIPVLKEAESAKWLKAEDLYSVNWLPADISILNKINDELKLKVFIDENNWQFSFENQDSASDCEQSLLSRLIFKRLFETTLGDKFSCFLNPKDKIALYVNSENCCKAFLFDLMHNPTKKHQPYVQAEHFGRLDEITFKDIYHTIGNFSPVPRTIVTFYYGPNLQILHNCLNEMWPWFLKYLMDNWTEWPTKIYEIMSFKEYMKCSCQQIYYQSIFEKFYSDETIKNFDVLEWEPIIREWNEAIDDKNFDGKLISFNDLFEEKNFGEINNRIRFLIEARGRCILAILKYNN